MIRCLIVDDEPLARQLLVGYAEQIPYLEVVTTCETALEAFAILHQEKIDLLFLDIQMPGISGISFLQSLKNPPQTIFITAHADYAIDAFTLDARDYLLKPVIFERFLQAVQKIKLSITSLMQNQTAFEEKAIFIKVNKRFVRLAFDTILYLESLGDYLKVHTATQTYITYNTLNKIRDILPARQFIRIHKSYMVNINNVESADATLVVVAGNELPLGNAYKEELWQRMDPK